MKRVSALFPFFSIAGLVILIALLGATGSSAADVKKAENVSAMMDWVFQGRVVFFLAALDKGYYRDENLNVDILRGQGAPKTVEAVDQGKMDFGFGDFTPLILARAKGAKVKAIGMICDITPQGLGGLKERGIKSPKDLEGRKVGMSAFTATRQMLPIMAKLNGVDYKKIEIVTISEALLVSSILNGDVDMAATWRGSSHAVLENEVKKKGKEIAWLGISDWGIDIYGPIIFTSDKVIKEKPDLIKRFLAATYKGVDFAVKNPDQAVEIAFRLHPEIGNKDVLKAQWMETLPEIMTERARQKGYGWIAEEKMKKTRDLVLEAYEIAKDSVPLNDLYTNEFLPSGK